MHFSNARRTSPLRAVMALVTLFSLLLAGAAAAQSRSLETAYGEVEIEGTPERVVTLYEGALDAALAVDVSPVAAVATRGGQGVARYIEEQAGDIAIVGTAREINIEAVLAQQPDVILASPTLPDSQYRLLSNIAPTVVPEREGLQPEGWKAETRLFARALARQDQAASVIEDIESRAQDIAAEIAQRHDAGDRGAFLARWMPPGPLVMSAQLFSSGLLESAGFEVADSDLVAEGRPHSDPLSLEALSRIDGDWLFLATLNEDGEEALEEAREMPAFQRLEVVRNDRVVPVDGQLWTSASGPLAAQAILEDIRGAALN